MEEGFERFEMAPGVLGVAAPGVEAVTGEDVAGRGMASRGGSASRRATRSASASTSWSLSNTGVSTTVVWVVMLRSPPFAVPTPRCGSRHSGRATACAITEAAPASARGHRARFLGASR